MPGGRPARASSSTCIRTYTHFEEAKFHEDKSLYGKKDLGSRGGRLLLGTARAQRIANWLLMVISPSGSSSVSGGF